MNATTVANSMRPKDTFDDDAICMKCALPLCDVKIFCCGCVLHARCFQIPSMKSGKFFCPHCSKIVQEMALYPMSYGDIENARTKAALIDHYSRVRKRRKISKDTESTSDAAAVADTFGTIRTGRWTNEETDFVGEIISKFDSGKLPIVDGIKLNDFLVNMLNMSHSRLSKKMKKGTRLSARFYEGKSNHITNSKEANIFSELEEAFLDSVQCDLERAELKFSMEKEWRGLFSRLCDSSGIPIATEKWEKSMEKTSRRSVGGISTTSPGLDTPISLKKESIEPAPVPKNRQQHDPFKRTLFLQEAIDLMQHHQVPFEYIEAWAPSSKSMRNLEPSHAPDTNSRYALYFAGSATTEKVFNSSGIMQPLPFKDLMTYSKIQTFNEKISFDVGDEIPGIVCSSGIPVWENLSVDGFTSQPREEGWQTEMAKLGCQTLVCISVRSPKVGRIVLLLYSLCHRKRDRDMVKLLRTEFKKLMPSPKWELIVYAANKTKLVSDHQSEALQNSPHADNVNSNDNATDFQNNTISSEESTGKIIPNSSLSNSTHCKIDTKGITLGRIKKNAKTPKNPPSSSIGGGSNTLSQHSTEKHKRELIALISESITAGSLSQPQLKKLTALQMTLLKVARTKEEEHITRVLMKLFLGHSSAGHSRKVIIKQLVLEYEILSNYHRLNDSKKCFKYGNKSNQFE